MEEEPEIYAQETQDLFSSLATMTNARYYWSGSGSACRLEQRRDDQLIESVRGGPEIGPGIQQEKSVARAGRETAAQNSQLLPIDSRPIAPPLNGGPKPPAPGMGKEPVPVRLIAEITQVASDQSSGKIVIAPESPGVSSPPVPSSTASNPHFQCLPFRTLKI